MEVFLIIALVTCLYVGLIETTHVLAISLGILFAHYFNYFDSLSGFLSLCVISVVAVFFLLDDPSSYLFLVVGFFLYSLKNYLE